MKEPQALAGLVDPTRPQPELTARILSCPCPGELRAGLLLMNGDWELAHQASQALESPLAAHWHALVHRHEPDFDNAKYWYRRVGVSPVFATLAAWAQQSIKIPDPAEGMILHDPWDPFRFTDLFAAGHEGDWTRQVDRQEMGLLLEYSLKLAT